MTLPSGTVTFLFTDIEGSTRLAQEHPNKWEDLRARHHAILQSAMDAHNGYVFQIIGDAFCVAFHTAAEALRAAIKSQNDLHDEDWSDTPIRVRMGINTGTARASEDTDRSGGYTGYTSMARVQRLMSAANGGQTLISLATEELVRDELPENITLRDMGERRLKDLIRPEHIYQLVIPNLPVEFPPIKTLDAYRHNLPIQLTSFVGRKKEMAQVEQTLKEHRLVTLTGSAGTGKTRLSLQVAADMTDQFNDGVWIAELASVSDSELALQTIRFTLGINEQKGRTNMQMLTDYLQEKNLLLVLDNCEHLIEASAILADTLLNHAHSLKILATSREALGVKGEATLQVPSLSLPGTEPFPSIEHLRQYEAVQLFIERAVLVKPDFKVDKYNASFVVQICSRLDGIPLAIELAASRVRALSVEQIAVRLDDRFRLLTGGARTTLPRQQTLRATLNWSYNLLSEPEKVTLRVLAVFSGGWTLEAAESICGQLRDGYNILDLLTQLVDKSLVTMQDSRYRMLETTRLYASEKLVTSGEAESIKNRHCDWFLALAERAKPEIIGGRLFVYWLERLDADHDNFRIALGYLHGRKESDLGARLATALWRFWFNRGYFQEGHKWLEGFLTHRENLSRAVLAETLYACSRFTSRHGDFGLARAYAKESVALFREVGDKSKLAWALRALGQSGQDRGSDLKRDEPFLAEAMSIFQEIGDQTGVLFVSSDLCWNALIQNDLGRCLSITKELLALARKLDNTLTIAYGLMILGTTSLLQGNADESEKFLRESLVITQKINEIFAIIANLEGIAGVSNIRGQTMRSARLLGACRKLDDTHGIVRDENWKHMVQEPIIASVRNQMGEEAFHKASEEGKSMTLEQAIEYALEVTNE